MVDKSVGICPSHLNSQLESAGISPVSIDNAAEVAKQLCRESSSGMANSDDLNPYHVNDYQTLFFELSQTMAK